MDNIIFAYSVVAGAGTGFIVSYFLANWKLWQIVNGLSRRVSSLESRSGKEGRITGNPIIDMLIKIVTNNPDLIMNLMKPKEAEAVKEGGKW